MSRGKKSFLADIAIDLKAKKDGSDSDYATFLTLNNKTVTVRLANHNASTSNFDYRSEKEGISIVISRKPNEGITNDGYAHVVEFFYPDKKLPFRLISLSLRMSGT